VCFSGRFCAKNAVCGCVCVCVSDCQCVYSPIYFTATCAQITVDKDAEVSMSDAQVTDAQLDSTVSAVVVGWDRDLTFRKLTLASLYLRNFHRDTTTKEEDTEDESKTTQPAPCRLFATNRDRYDKVGRGRVISGNGPAITYVLMILSFCFGLFCFLCLLYEVCFLTLIACNITRQVLGRCGTSNGHLSRKTR
jgi:hypothetical protein